MVAVVDVALLLTVRLVSSFRRRGERLRGRQLLSRDELRESRAGRYCRRSLRSEL